MFYHILEQRNAFLECKNKKLKKSKKIEIFPMKLKTSRNGLVHGFGRKLVIFPDFLF